MDYANSKIYKITGGGMTYYGSTTQALSKRMYCHKTNSNNCISKIIMETGEAVIVLVELFPCKSKEELFSRERWFIENNDCVNKNIPMRTDKEIKERKIKYKINNADKINEHNKQYRIDNKDKIKQYYIENIDKLKEKMKEYSKQYRVDNADKIKERAKQYYLQKKEQINNL